MHKSGLHKRSLLLLLLALPACRGELLGTAKLLAPGTAEVRLNTNKDVELWSDFEGSWEGGSRSSMPLDYQIEVFQEGSLVGQVSCSTLVSSTRMCGSHTNVMSSHHGDCETRMSCELPAHRPGEMLLRVTGRIADPARVKEVDRMSLNVRAK